jgi:hypothetical protein
MIDSDVIIELPYLGKPALSKEGETLDRRLVCERQLIFFE